MTDRQKNFLLDSLVWFVALFAITLLVGYTWLHASSVMLLVGTTGSLAGGLILGSFQSRFSTSYKILRAIDIELEDAERLLLEGPANYIINDHMLSGKLILTQQRLLFKSYKEEEYNWQLSTLEHFNFHSSLFNIGGEFVVETDQQAKLAFEVDNLKLWKNSLFDKEKDLGAQA